MSTNTLNKAISKHIQTATTDIEEAERQREQEQLAKAPALADQQNLYVVNWGSGGVGGTLTTASNITWATSQAVTVPTFTTTSTTTSSSVSMGGTGFYPSAAYIYSGAPPVTFTAEQMTLLMDKLAYMLIRGWECIRCHRVWSPQVVGCEFCNFIDRLEGKDVDRDTAA